MEEQELVAGMGEIVVSHNPKILCAIGLGSCIGLALFDKDARIGGLAHIMLPNSMEFSGVLNRDRDTTRLLKYADVAIPKMIEDMIKIGARRSNVHAKMAGGAQMFQEMNNNDVMQIGFRNAAAVKKILNENKIPIDAEDTGGNCGRSIKFDISTQKLLIKTIREIKEI